MSDRRVSLLRPVFGRVAFPNEFMAEFYTTTSFGGQRQIERDPLWARPNTDKERRSQIERTRLINHWDKAEFAENCRLIGLDPKPLDGYSSDELQIILDDFERRRMVLYED